MEVVAIVVNTAIFVCEWLWWSLLLQTTHFATVFIRGGKQGFPSFLPHDMGRDGVERDMGLVQVGGRVLVQVHRERGERVPPWLQIPSEKQ